jgi:hypothetical protein
MGSGTSVVYNVTLGQTAISKTVDVLATKSKWLANTLTALGYDVTEDAQSISSAHSSPDQQELEIVQPSSKGIPSRRSIPALMHLMASLARLNLIETFPKLLISAPLIGSPDYKFVAHLDREHLLVTSLAELAGEMKVFGRLEQRLTSPFRTGGLTPDIIKRLHGSIEDEALARTLIETAKHFDVETPVAVFEPVAIYR